MKALSVLMPVYNESRTLRTIVQSVLDAPVGLDIELICVDDCSTDGSLEILNELAANDPRIKVIAQRVNMGKGRAIRTAIDAMTGDVAIIQDADLEYDPKSTHWSSARSSTEEPMPSMARVSPPVPSAVFCSFGIPWATKC